MDIAWAMGIEESKILFYLTIFRYLINKKRQNAQISAICPYN